MMQAMQYFRDCVQLISVLLPVQRRQQFRREQRARHTHYWGSLFLHTNPSSASQGAHRRREGSTCEEHSGRSADSLYGTASHTAATA
jgi:hypothetical protein